MTLRKTYKTWHKAKETAENLKEIINEKFSNEKLYELFCNEIYQPADGDDIEDWLANLEVEEHE